MIDRFSIRDKLLMRIGLGGYLIVGGIAVFLESTAWGIAYLIVAGPVSVSMILFSLCARCPYPETFGDCLFMPAGLVKRIAPHRPGPMTASEQAVLIAGILVGVAFPQYWLWQNIPLLLLYLAFLVPLSLAFPLFYCPRCRHGSCPMKRLG